MEHSGSPWFTESVVYRKFNSVTKKDAHSLPRVDDLLDALAGSKYFSTVKTGKRQGKDSICNPI